MGEHDIPLRVSTVDYHTGGEPFRIVTGGVRALEGGTVLERRRFAGEVLDRYFGGSPDPETERRL